jgi:hypothetical protein
MTQIVLADDGEQQPATLRARPSAVVMALIVVEVALIFAFYFFFAAVEPPNVNESHYLTKAKHYWNPEWCPNDLFLSSGDAHLVFYWTLGWLTQFWDLPTVAWIGRIAVWLLTAIAWQRLSSAVIPRPLISVLSAGFALTLIEQFHMAGEWMIGGIEAKGLAFVFMLLGISEIVRGRWRWTWVWFGIAAAFHVLIGGWSVIAAMIAWSFSGAGRATIVQQLPWLAGGFLISLVGLIPVVVLNLGVDAETAALANQIYTYGRLEHHLVFSAFETRFVMRHLALTSLWIVLSLLTLRRSHCNRLNAFVLGVVAIALAGIAIDQIILMTLDNRPLAASLLRFYWFRLSDLMIPIGVTFSLLGLVMRNPGSRDSLQSTKEKMERYVPQRLSWKRMTVTGAVLLIFLSASAWQVTSKIRQRNFDPRPPADQKMREISLITRDQDLRYEADWIEVCDWIRDNTAVDALFLTPRDQQTFKWYAHRAEVVNGKDIPQDAARIVTWQQRYQDVYPPFVKYNEYTFVDTRYFGLLAFNDQLLRERGQKYAANYLLVERRFELNRIQSGEPLRLTKVFPSADTDCQFSVFRLDD